MRRYYDAKKNKNTFPRTVLCLVCALVTVGVLGWMALLFGGGTPEKAVNVDIMGKLDAYVADSVYVLSVGEEGADNSVLKKAYRLSDEDLVAPKPNPACYGFCDDPAQMKDVLEAAQSLLEGQKTLFTTETPIMEGTSVQYYLDETIFAVTWKQPVEGSAYTMSEVKIAHPSQFRRFFSEGKYGAGILHTTTEMSESVNAVVAASGDYHGYRGFGVVVNNGQVYRARGKLLDTCYVDENGDLQFILAKETGEMEAIQKYVDENQIRFSLSFGPLMIQNGEVCVPGRYNSGEINEPYARAALCQMDKLHYVVVTANTEKPCYTMPTVKMFAEQLWLMGIPTAYALDGGQTASIAMNHTLINNVSYGSQREISDILYFATAVPDGN